MTTACPCKSTLRYDECCKPIIDGSVLAKTAEQLMRSRYSAYAKEQAKYIFDTYSNISKEQLQEKNILDSSRSCQWVNLIVHNSTQFSAQEAINNIAAIVEFSAYYIENKQLCIMRERSNFVLENNQWRYHDGEIIEHKIMEKVNRNAPCPCQQNKKYKQCCLKLMA